MKQVLDALLQSMVSHGKCRNIKGCARKVKYWKGAKGCFYLGPLYETEAKQVLATLLRFSLLMKVSLKGAKC